MTECERQAILEVFWYGMEVDRTDPLEPTPNAGDTEE